MSEVEGSMAAKHSGAVVLKYRLNLDAEVTNLSIPSDAQILAVDTEQHGLGMYAVVLWVLTTWAGPITARAADAKGRSFVIAYTGVAIPRGDSIMRYIGTTVAPRLAGTESRVVRHVFEVLPD